MDYYTVTHYSNQNSIIQSPIRYTELNISQLMSGNLIVNIHLLFIDCKNAKSCFGTFI